MPISKLVKESASDLLLQYLLQGGARQRGLGGRGLQEEEGGGRETARQQEEAEQERRGGEERVGEEDEEAAEAEAEAEEAERARQNALLFAEEEEGEAGAEDKRSQEETPGHRRKEAEGAEEGGAEAAPLSTRAATAGFLVQKSDMQPPPHPSDWHEILYELKHLTYGRETGEFSQKFQVQMVMTFKPTPVSSREPLNTAQVNTAKTGCAKHAHY